MKLSFLTSIAWRNGRPVRLEEVANVIDSVEDDKSASWVYTKDTAERSIDSAMEAMREFLNGSLAVRHHVDHPGTPLGARRHGLRTWRENSPAARGW